jgi:superfamily I DNA/RNA helicase
VAGSGKTTVLLDAAVSLPPSKRVLMLAFNKAVQQELAERLGARRNVEVKTYHGCGFHVLSRRLQGRHRIDDQNKRRGLLKRLLPDDKDYQRLNGCVLALSSFAASYAFQTTSQPDTSDALLQSLLERYDVEQPIVQLTATSEMLVADLRLELRALGLSSSGKKAELQARLSSEDAMKKRMRRQRRLMCERVFGLVRSLLEATAHEAEQAGRIDFSDMCYLPIRWELGFPQYDFVFVDEVRALEYTG